MAQVDLTETQAAFLETWLDAILPDPDDVDTETLVAQIDMDALDLPDIWDLARSRADASIAALREVLEKDDDPNSHRIARYGLIGVTGGNHVQITSGLLAYGTATPDERPARATELDKALTTLETHLATSPLVDLLEDNAFDIPVSIRAPLQSGIDAIRRKILA